MTEQKTWCKFMTSFLCEIRVGRWGGGGVARFMSQDLLLKDGSAVVPVMQVQ